MNAPTDYKVLTVSGTYESHRGTDQQYETISVQELMTIERTAVPKDQARWVLCSTYNEPDARKHKAQEENGSFVMLAVDLDTGNVQGKALVAAVQSFTGDVQMRVYSSSSATKENRKWRVLIPLASPLAFSDWLAATTALNQHIESELGHRPDRALERAGQPIYLPNTAPRTDDIEPLIADQLITGALLDPSSCPGTPKIEAVAQEEAQRQQEIEGRAAEARRRMAQLRAKPNADKSVINEFNAATDLEQMLAACGYVQGTRGGWRSPRQTTNSHATKVFDEPSGQYWVSLSLSDLEAGIGSHTSDGRCCFGDAFDLWCFHFYGNDRTAAIKAAAAELGISPPPTQVDVLADIGRRNATMKAQQMLAQASQDQPGQVEPAPAAAPQDSAKETLTEFDEGYVPPAKDESLQSLLSFVQASNLPDWTPPREMIEGMLIENRMSVVYGDSNTGKSFLVLDMAAHLTLGLEWFGKRVKKGAVLYLAAEAPRSIIDRSRALAQKLDAKLDNLFITDCPIDIYNPNGDTAAIVATVHAIEKSYQTEISLIVVDTLARAIGSGDENATKDMGVLVQHSDMIRSNTRAHVMFVHHTGKDASRGARGSSALRAATDTEIEVSDPGDNAPKEFRVTKQRDLDGKGDIYAFHLTRVNLGVGVFDNLMTTCYVERAEPASADPYAGLKDGEMEVIESIRTSPFGAMRYSELVGSIHGVSKITVKRYISNLRKKGLIHEKMGQYRLGNGISVVSNEIRGQEF